MTNAGFGPLLKSVANKFPDLAYLRHQYADIQDKPAFKDFVYRIQQTRDGMEENLIRSDGLDKFGNKHDDEIRAVLHCLDTILGYIPAIEADFLKAEKNLEKIQTSSKTDSTRGVQASGWNYWS